MARITPQAAQAWVQTTKFRIDDLDGDLLAQLEGEVLGRIASSYDTSTWLDPSTTPELVRTIIAKMYASWLYNKAYAEDEAGTPEYAIRLQANADLLMDGIIDGTIELPAPAANTNQGGAPSFYPTDLSSEMEPTSDDMSLGGPYFSMGSKF